MSDRDIVVYGYDNDISEMVFKRKTIPEKYEPKLIRQAGYYFNNFDCPSWNSSSKYC